MSNQEFYGGGNPAYPPQQPYGAPQYPQQPQYAPQNSPYPPQPNYAQNAPYPPQNMQPPYGAPGPSPAHSPSPYGAPPYQQSPYGGAPYQPPSDPYASQSQQQLAAYTDNRGYSPAPSPYGSAPPYGAPSPAPGLAPTYNEPGANMPPPQLDANGNPVEGDRGLISMGLGAAGGWGVASQTGRGTMGKLLYAAGGMIAGQFLGNKVKKYRKDQHTGRDVEYYEDEQGREVSPPRDGEGLHHQGGGLHPGGHGGGYRDEKYGGHGGYEDERHGRHHGGHEHHHGHHHGHEHRSHSRHSSHSHGRHHDDRY